MKSIIEIEVALLRFRNMKVLMSNYNVKGLYVSYVYTDFIRGILIVPNNVAICYSDLYCAIILEKND